MAVPPYYIRELEFNNVVPNTMVLFVWVCPPKDHMDVV